VSRSDHVLSVLLEKFDEGVAREEILRFYAFDCCIATTWILRRVLSKFGIHADAIPVSVAIGNRRWAELIDRGVRFPEDRRELPRFLELHGAYSVGLVALDPSRVPHVVLVVRGIVIDGSIEQANRPEKKIVLPKCLAIPATAEFLAGLPLTLEVNEVRLQYRKIADGSFVQSPDWRRRDENERIARRIIDRIGRIA